MDFKNTKAIVTGGAGFIGSHVARRLVSYGAKVTVVDSLIPEYGGNLFNLEDIRDKISLNISDVRDPHSLKHLIQNHDFLFSLAGQTSHLDSMDNPFIDLEINAKAQLSILEACRKHNKDIRVVFASTRQIYGKPQYLPVDEEHPLKPVDINGVNKMSGESFHLIYHSVYGIKTCVLRLTNTYGPGMRVKDARQTFLGIWIKKVLSAEPIEIYGSGEQLRDFNYVDDVVDAFLAASQSEKSYGQVFNLGSDEHLSLNELGTLLCQLAKQGQCVHKDFPETLKKIDIGDYYSSWEKAKEYIGWRPTTSLSDGLSKTLDYYRANSKQYW